MSTVALLVLNYQGRGLLEEHLPTVVAAAENYPGASVYLVDNHSRDGSCEFVEERFPAVRLVRMATNRYLFSLNPVCERLSEPLVVFLNNDVSVEPDFLNALLAPFACDPQLFAVSCKTWGPDGRLQMTWVEGKFDYGLQEPIYHLHDERSHPCPTFYASGGAAAFDREKFLELGGFDPVFWPIYWEDVDLCYRAWRRGWPSLYAPGSEVHHQHCATTVGRVMSPRKIQTVKFRNQIVFTWKNVSDARILWMSLRTVLWHLRRGESWRVRAILEALLLLPRILLRRPRCARGVPDRTVCPLVYE